MKITLKIDKEFEAKYLQAKVGARYWEDATVNGVEDTEGTLIPCREGDYWCPIIDIETGAITNWIKGVNASIHYKSCDDNDFNLLDENKEVIISKDGYVINSMCPNGGGYGDYVKMDIDADGKIYRWYFYDTDFNDED